MFGMSLVLSRAADVQQVSAVLGSGCFRGVSSSPRFSDSDLEPDRDAIGFKLACSVREGLSVLVLRIL
ncbi:Hypothetical protein DEACI_2223 [Acididesulfobacillus acetoxydans]|uniref:Uncharacterized protein n=1 Tax=Acididesulfobacillus acetoxydans TaxID=1561005 RepID=A0A8S0XBS5_9FIRM|nr:Hypothetical protein DEACI_2223 [Acididesulfobacillus acetoxydans]CEJ07043.1 Hypothetical protein DEACI_1499 [Acididesulfobacillus acetoxydans]